MTEVLAVSIALPQSDKHTELEKVIVHGQYIFYTISFQDWIREK